MKWLNFENIKNLTFFITPNLPIITTKRYKYSIFRIAAYLGLYTLAAWFVLVIILAFTPLKDYLFVINNNDLKTQTEKIRELQSRVVVLTNQLQDLASINERMRYALKLSNRDSSKPNDPIYDTLQKKIDKKIKIGGNIFDAFKNLFEKYFQEDKTRPDLFFIEPITGIVTQEFNQTKGHMGVDFGAANGTPIFASAGGLIIFSDYSVDSGYQIIIQHEKDFISVYKHCSSLIKKTRERVNQNELIAFSGNSGKNTTGPHLHFEIWQNGKPIDPQKVLLK